MSLKEKNKEIEMNVIIQRKALNPHICKSGTGKGFAFLPEK